MKYCGESLIAEFFVMMKNLSNTKPPFLYLDVL